jgi:hypothetical protein
LGWSTWELCCSIQRFSSAAYRFSAIGLVVMAVAMMLSLHGQAQPASPASTSGKVAVFLADPQLGVVGAYQGGGQTLYFEARTPEGLTQMSARLLDAAGRTIAISGHSMDAQWLARTEFYPVSAVLSLSLAQTLPGVLKNALDAIVFAREITALSNLAVGAAQVSPGTEAVTIDSATANLPPRTDTEIVAADAYDAAAAKALSTVRDPDGNLSSTLDGVRLDSFVRYFPDEPNEGGTLGRYEVSARLLSPAGTSLIQQLGGDEIPEGWDSEVFRPVPSPTTDPMQRAIEAGNAIRAAALMVRFPSIATAEETDATSDLVAALRDDSLLPHPASVVTDSSPCVLVKCYYETNVQVWRKWLVYLIAQHSGSIVLHYYSSDGGLFFNFDYQTIYCNHGTCPRAKNMTHTCTFRGPVLTHYRYPPHAKITRPPGVGGLHSCYGTPYHLDSGSINYPGHNCNDDTWTQIRAVRGESEGPDSHRCNDVWPDDYAPGCGS